MVEEYAHSTCLQRKIRDGSAVPRWGNSVTEIGAIPTPVLWLEVWSTLAEEVCHPEERRVDEDLIGVFFMGV